MICEVSRGVWIEVCSARGGKTSRPQQRETQRAAVLVVAVRRIIPKAVVDESLPNDFSESDRRTCDHSCTDKPPRSFFELTTELDLYKSAGTSEVGVCIRQLASDNHQMRAQFILNTPSDSSCDTFTTCLRSLCNSTHVYRAWH